MEMMQAMMSSMNNMSVTINNLDQKNTSNMNSLREDLNNNITTNINAVRDDIRDDMAQSTEQIRMRMEALQSISLYNHTDIVCIASALVVL